MTATPKIKEASTSAKETDTTRSTESFSHNVEKPLKYKEAYDKFSNSFFSTNVRLEAAFIAKRNKMFDAYTQYAKYEVRKHF